MSYDNRFPREESRSSYDPGEKILPRPPWYRRYLWQILGGVLGVLVLVMASFLAGLVSGQHMAIMTNAPAVTATQPLPTVVPVVTATQPPPTQPLIGPTPVLTQIPTQFMNAPHLAPYYTGTMHSITANATATFTLTSIEQTQGEFNGYVSIGPGLDGSGLFTGQFKNNGSFSFLDVPTAGMPTLVFSGSWHADGSLGGTYTALSQHQQGTWQASPLS